jgi:hypothetical protein
MSKAEDLAEKLYPKKEHVAYGPFPCEEPNMIDANKPYRIGFMEGYQQAEKDLALTWKDVYGILYSERMVMREWFKEHKEENIAEDDSNEVFCSEVLKRFNKQRKEK